MFFSLISWLFGSHSRRLDRQLLGFIGFDMLKEYYYPVFRGRRERTAEYNEPMRKLLLTIILIFAGRLDCFEGSQLEYGIPLG